MMTKEEALQVASSLGASGVLTRDELVSAFEEGALTRGDTPAPVASTAPASPRSGTGVGIAEVMYYLGGAVVVIGVATLIAQNWSSLSLLTKLLATLGSGAAAFAVGVVLARRSETEKIGPAFFLISALVTPIGLAVLMDGADWQAGSNASQSLNAVAMLAIFGAAFYLLRRMVLLIFTVIYGTWLFFGLTGLFRADASFGDSWRFDALRVLAAGSALAVLGYGLRSTAWKALCGTLFGGGILGFLGAAMILGGWKPDNSLGWDLAFPLLVFGCLFAGVYLRSTAALTVSTIMLMAYILKITSEFFTEGLGWPFALVLAGLAMIGVGYLSLLLRRRYLST